MHILENLLNSVAFIASKDSAGNYHFAGSLFFLGKQVPGTGRCERVFAVTALHVIENICRLHEDPEKAEVFLRLNIKGATSTWHTTRMADWHWIKGALVDVAIMEMGIPAELDHLVIPFNLCCEVAKLNDERFGLGGEVAIMGLYVRQPGVERNMPIVRVGNMASIVPQPIKTTRYGEINGVLVEARSIGGLSGSPVFAVYPLFYAKNGVIVPHSGDTVKLFGMIHGHHELNSKSPNQVGPTDAKLELDNLNTGVAIVVPLEDVIRTIQSREKELRGTELEIRFE